MKTGVGTVEGRKKEDECGKILGRGDGDGWRRLADENGAVVAMEERETKTGWAY